MTGRDRRAGCVALGALGAAFAFLFGARAAGKALCGPLSDRYGNVVAIVVTDVAIIVTELITAGALLGALITPGARLRATIGPPVPRATARRAP